MRIISGSFRGKKLIEPKDIKTSEKPNANNIIGKILTVFFSISSFNELPDI